MLNRLMDMVRQWVNPFRGWKGATPAWSPKASVAAVGGTAAWDVRGWYSESERRTHEELKAVERRLWTGLDELLASVYAWRDAEWTT